MLYSSDEEDTYDIVLPYDPTLPSYGISDSDNEDLARITHLAEQSYIEERLRNFDSSLGPNFQQAERTNLLLHTESEVSDNSDIHVSLEQGEEENPETDPIIFSPNSEDSNYTHVSVISETDTYTWLQSIRYYYYFVKYFIAAYGFHFVSQFIILHKVLFLFIVIIAHLSCYVTNVYPSRANLQ